MGHARKIGSVVGGEWGDFEVLAVAIVHAHHDADDGVALNLVPRRTGRGRPDNRAASLAHIAPAI
jgi:hypothetical protein